MKKKTTRKRLVLYIILAVISFLMVGVCFYFAIKFDPYGKKPYIIILTVLGVIGFLLLTLFYLLKIYPYANEYDKKKLKNKLFKNISMKMDVNELKTLLCEKFEYQNGIYEKSTKRNGLFSEIKYRLFFSTQNEIDDIVEKIRKNNKKGYDLKTKYNSQRQVDIYFIELNQFSNIEKLEEELDVQYLDILKDPEKIIVPIIYHVDLKNIYYYEKWTKLNITILAVATNYIKKLLIDINKSVSENE